MKHYLKAFLQFLIAPRDQFVDLNAGPNHTAWYEPAQGEPSPFDLRDGVINPLWLSWYMVQHDVTVSDAVIAGHYLKKRLIAETDPPIPHAVPDILLTVGGQLVLSLAWVMWYRNEYGVSYMEAHYQGVLLTTRYEAKQA